MSNEPDMPDDTSEELDDSQEHSTSPLSLPMLIGAWVFCGVGFLLGAGMFLIVVLALFTSPRELTKPSALFFTAMGLLFGLGMAAAFATILYRATCAYLRRRRDDGQ